MQGRRARHEQNMQGIIIATLNTVKSLSTSYQQHAMSFAAMLRPNFAILKRQLFRQVDVELF